MMHLSMVYCDLKELELSDQLGNESIALTRKFDAENGEELSRTLFSRATTLCKAGRFDEAKVYADESIQVVIKKMVAKIGDSDAIFHYSQISKVRAID